ncbi:MAG: hypothetical protein Q7S16_05015 [bacterium]|nr:hypothetical protein [bacterium]
MRESASSQEERGKEIKEKEDFLSSHSTEKRFLNRLADFGISFSESALRSKKSLEAAVNKQLDTVLDATANTVFGRWFKDHFLKRGAIPLVTALSLLIAAEHITAEAEAPEDTKRIESVELPEKDATFVASEKSAASIQRKDERREDREDEQQQSVLEHEDISSVKTASRVQSSYQEPLRINDPLNTVSGVEKARHKQGQGHFERLRMDLVGYLKSGNDLPLAYTITPENAGRALSIISRDPNYSSIKPNVLLKREFNWNDLGRTDAVQLLLQEQYEEGGMDAFNATIRENGTQLSDAQKVLLLADFGRTFLRNYNDADKKTNAIPYAQMIDHAMRFAKTDEVQPTGVCRHIAVALATLGRDMGIPTFVADLTTNERSGHAVMGVQEKNGGIVFIDYGVVIPTGSTNIRDACRALEILYGASAIHNTYYDASGLSIAQYVTRAGEDLRVSGNMQDLNAMLMDPLILGEKSPLPVDVSVSQEKSEVTVHQNGYFFAVTKFDRRDPLNALASLHALRFGTGSVEGDAQGARGKSLDITYAVAQHKDSEDWSGTKVRTPEQQSLLLNAAIAKAWTEKGKGISLRPRLAAQLAAQYNLSAHSFDTIETGGGGGFRLAYVDPHHPQSVFLEAGSSFLAEIDNVQKRAGAPRILLPKPYIRFGGELSVREVKFHLDTVVGEENEHRTVTIEPKIIFGHWKGAISYKRETGDVKFIDRDNEFKAQLERQGIHLGNLEGAVTIYGAQSKGGGNPDEMIFGAQLSILF